MFERFDLFQTRSAASTTSSVGTASTAAWTRTGRQIPSPASPMAVTDLAAPDAVDMDAAAIRSATTSMAWAWAAPAAFRTLSSETRSTCSETSSAAGIPSRSCWIVSTSHLHNSIQRATHIYAKYVAYSVRHHERRQESHVDGGKLSLIRRAAKAPPPSSSSPATPSQAPTGTSYR